MPLKKKFLIQLGVQRPYSSTVSPGALVGGKEGAPATNNLDRNVRQGCDSNGDSILLPLQHLKQFSHPRSIRPAVQKHSSQPRPLIINDAVQLQS
jgi:hypothetical protein